MNYQKYRESYINARHLNHEYPIDVSLELSSYCNMRCSYCYHSDQDSLPFTVSHMSPVIAKKILFQAFLMRVPSVKMNWKGESTLNPDFHSILKYAKDLNSKDKDAFMDRLTNSNFKFKNDNDAIFEALSFQTKVKISYDSFRKEVFETQRARGNHDLTTANIDKFYNWPGRTTQMVIQAVRTQLNKDEDIAHEASKRWPDAKISIRDMVAGRVDKDLSGLENRVRDDSERQSCIQAHARVIFNKDGKAFPCCPDVEEKLCIGDINKNNLYEIFNSASAKLLRNQLKSGKAFEREPCKSCSSFETFRGYVPSWDS